MKPESYKTFLQKIVDQHLPNESLIFKVEGDSMIQELFENENISQETKNTQALGAADFASASAVIGIVSVGLTCFKLILEIKKLKKELKPVDTDKIKKAFENRLRRKGIKPKKAKRIAEDFALEMIELAK